MKEIKISKEKITIKIFDHQTYTMNVNPKDDWHNPVTYIVSDYCKKYPDDDGNERIYDNNMVRPRNHNWAGKDEQRKWFYQNGYISRARVPTYGTCQDCWASGPNYQPCQECDKGPYKLLMYSGYIIDSVLSCFFVKWYNSDRRD
jgi:hypothetical protein